MKINLRGELTIMDSLEVKPNYAALGRKYGMDWRTVKKYHQGCHRLIQAWNANPAFQEVSRIIPLWFLSSS